MTLILTALCNDGISVCADTRYKDNRWKEGYRDGFDKIHKFKSYPLIIFNHGVNRFGEKYWSDYCLDYEELGRWRKWKDKRLISISNDFGNCIDGVVLQQLSANAKQWPNDSSKRKSGFALCGKNPRSDCYEIYELFWNPRLEKVVPYPWSGVRINGFGDGYQYLKDDIDKLVDWQAFNLIQAEKELAKIFSVAKDRKELKGGDEFSDDYTIKSIKNNSE